MYLHTCVCVCVCVYVCQCVCVCDPLKQHVFTKKKLFWQQREFTIKIKTCWKRVIIPEQTDRQTDPLTSQSTLIEESVECDQMPDSFKFSLIHRNL